jgi:hypothetical protein
MYQNAIETHLRGFIRDYIYKNATSLDDFKKERIIYSMNTWLEDQNVFGDLNWHEVWLGLASNSKSPLIRMMQDVIDNM